MTIQEFTLKIKNIFSPDVIVVIIIILVGFSSFGLGRLSVIENSKDTVRVEIDQSAVIAESIKYEDTTLVGGKFVASKNSTIYHFPWCSGAKRIAEKNKIYFNSKEEAKSAGYRKAANCKGL